MGDKSAIEWTDATWNPVSGCTKISPGCKFCYAERITERFGQDFSKIILHPDRLDQPLRWKKPRRIFVNSMSDLFHEAVPDEFIERVFDSMLEAPQHIYQVLTKRPKRMKAWITQWLSPVLTEKMLENIWLAVSAEDQQRADERIPLLLHTPAAVRFVSLEPLLSGINIRPYLPHAFNRGPHCPWCEDCIPDTPGLDWWRETREDKHGPFLDWIICGGESGGPPERALVSRQPDDGDIGACCTGGSWYAKGWAVNAVRSLRDQCVSAGVPFFFKQWGGVTSKSGGHMVDGRKWDQYPGGL